VAEVSMKGKTIHVTLQKDTHDYSFLPSMLIEAGFRLSLFREEDVNLETAFMELTKGVQQ
jgi:ABC-2 type transport system ATP-binding protein